MNKLKLGLFLVFIGIFALGAYFRLSGVNWDQNQHLHPDERFLTMVATGIDWPHSVWEYLETSISPLNPHNRGSDFFVYGTFPLFFTKWIAGIFNEENYNGITIVGRQLSAIFDIGTMILIFLIAQEVVSSIKYQVSGIKNKKILNTKYLIHNTFPLLAMFFYACSVLPIQLSHFFAVDTYLTFFITLSFYLCVKLLTLKTTLNIGRYKILNLKYQKYILNIKYYLYPVLIGLSFGLALASKISALLFLPIIFFFFVMKPIILASEFRNHKISVFNFLYVFLIFNILFLIFSFFTLRFAYPYLFTNSNIFEISLNQKVVDNWKQLKSFDDPSGWFPPAVQWIKTKPYAFPLKNMLYWGLGLPLGIISIIAVLYSILGVIYYVLKRKSYLLLNTYYLILILSLLWVLLLFGYQGMQFAKAMRYFYPIYPFIAILTAYFTFQMINYYKNRYKLRKKTASLVYLFIGLLVIIYPLSYMAIYNQPSTRLQASYWIYENIPEGSKIALEHWDDPLPLLFPFYKINAYKSTMLPLYDKDTEEKWVKINEILANSDYIVLSSNRLYGSITTVPEKYPLTDKYYKALFNGSLGFTKVAEFSSRPNIPVPFLNLCLTPPLSKYGNIAKKLEECPLPGISLEDDYADESFTVYDHPKVLIFKRIKNNPDDFVSYQTSPLSSPHQ